MKGYFTPFEGELEAYRIIKPCIEDIVSCGGDDNLLEVSMLYYGVLRGFKNLTCNIECNLTNQMKKSD
jgi:hypothetical protein